VTSPEIQPAIESALARVASELAEVAKALAKIKALIQIIATAALQ
jgi:hypothetical protein